MIEWPKETGDVCVHMGKTRPSTHHACLASTSSQVPPQTPPRISLFHVSRLKFPFNSVPLKLLTNDGFLQAGLHRQDILFYQLHGARPLCDLFIEVIGQPGSLQFQLLGLERRLSRGLYRGREGVQKDEGKVLVLPWDLQSNRS